MERSSRRPGVGMANCTSMGSPARFPSLPRPPSRRLSPRPWCFFSVVWCCLHFISAWADGSATEGIDKSSGRGQATQRQTTVPGLAWPYNLPRKRHFIWNRPASAKAVIAFALFLVGCNNAWLGRHSFLPQEKASVRSIRNESMEVRLYRVAMAAAVTFMRQKYLQ